MSEKKWKPKVGELVVVPKHEPLWIGSKSRSGIGVIVSSSSSGNYIEIFIENDLTIVCSKWVHRL